MAAISPYAAQVFSQLEQKVPAYWGAMTRGILKLKTNYLEEVINPAC